MTTLLFCALSALSLITNREELRFASCPEQVSDFSCGQAVVSGLLSSIGHNYIKDNVLSSRPYADPPDPEFSPRIPDRRMSALEILQLLRARGLDAAAFKIDSRNLPAALALGAPIIAHYDRPTLHFVLVYAANLGSRANPGSQKNLGSSAALGSLTSPNTVLVADPVEGSMVMPLQDFLARWSGVVIVARPGSGGNLPGTGPRIPGERLGGAEAQDRWLCLHAAVGIMGGRSDQRFP